jgi:hypothetical protein
VAFWFNGEHYIQYLRSFDDEMDGVPDRDAGASFWLRWILEII